MGRLISLLIGYAFGSFLTAEVVSRKICKVILFPNLCVIAAAYAGLGAILGHNFPIWHRFRGGKGVTCTCAALVSILFGYGIIAEKVETRAKSVEAIVNIIKSS